ncbi:zinc finger protein 1024 isoform X1 [Mastacembelus armatus]|uniref:zinc finger protein 1024 isoform X1 n=1 Tax=Mastacembelus armatus TaxID=205130 RepID=UPI000E464988|nr:zinc finger protein OZF-like isoform X1 [Mastacembelus armatus]XP_026181248.1 zinc finger protein OZF-like isoform X1 [Mastacembelus armatus]
MDTTMFQLRSFVHQRLYAAAEEILGEVEKTITLALHEADASRPKEEVENLPHQLGLLRKEPAAELPWTSSVQHRDECDSLLLQENPGPSTPMVSGSSQTSTDLHSGKWNNSPCRMFKIKEEQEEPGDESQTEEIGFPSSEMKCERDEAQVSYEMQPVSSDCSAAHSENYDSNEEGVDSEGDQTKRKIMQGQSGTDKAESPYESGSANGQKDRSFCHLCGRGFQCFASFLKHIKTHVKETDCNICGLRYESTKKLVIHLKHLHSKECFCDICGKIFDNNRNLRLHGRMHIEEKKILCQECGKTFNSQQQLIVHVRTHSGERPYHCDICDKAFSHKQNLRIHKRSHSGERPCHCGQCDKSFSTSSQLKLHMRYHSGERLYQCKFCGKSFPQNSQMKRHRTTHIGESC